MNPSDRQEKIEMAEDAVSRSVEKLEAAMEVLALRVEDSGRRVKHAVELATKSTEEILHIKDSIIEATQPLHPYFRQAVNSSSRVAGTVRRNPRSFLWAMAGLALGYVIWNSSQSRRRGLQAPALH